MDEYINSLLFEFEKFADLKIATGQRAYMKDKFDYFGLKSPIRKSLQKPFLLNTQLPLKENLEEIIRTLWNKPEREIQYFAQELLQKYIKQFEKKDLSLFEYMITHKSWWDTVDYIASNILGPYFMKFPELRENFIRKCIISKNMWLKRSALLFQLKYKDEVDTVLLSYAINSMLGSKEFFINKAIGWSLRQYSKFNPDWVIDYTNKTVLQNLSKREALRLIKQYKAGLSRGIRRL